MNLPVHFMLITLVWLAGALHLQAQAPMGVAPLLIGLLLPPEESEAVSLRRGAELGVEQVNRAGAGKVSLLVRGRVGQWGADGEEAGRMVLDDGARGLIAPPGGAPSHLALQVAGRTATPVISLCPDSSVVGAGLPWMVRIVPDNREEARLLFLAFPTNRAGRGFHWGAMVPTERRGRETSADLRHAAQGAGCLLDRPVEVGSKLTDSSEHIRRVMATQPDGILLWLEPPLAGALAKLLRAEGFEGRLAGPGHLQSASFTTNAGRAAEGFALGALVLDSASQAVADQFAVAYRLRFGCETDVTARLAYDAAVLLTSLLRKTGDNPARGAFPITSELPGASGRLEFDRNGSRLARLRVLEFRDGCFTPLAGSNTASAPP